MIHENKLFYDIFFIVISYYIIIIILVIIRVVKHFCRVLCLGLH
jgi:hypothetical protein